MGTQVLKQKKYYLQLINIFIYKNVYLHVFKKIKLLFFNNLNICQHCHIIILFLNKNL